MKSNVFVLVVLALLAGCGEDLGGQATHVDPHAVGVGRGAGSLTKARGPGTVSIANAPDLGTLLAYQRKAPTIRTDAYTLFPVSLSEAHAFASTLSGELTLAAPDGQPIHVRFARHEEYPDGNWSWIGHVEGGDPGREAIITFGERAVFGSIPRSDGSTLRLTTQAGQVYVMTIDPRNFKTTRRKAGPDAMATPASNGFIAASAQALAAAATAAVGTNVTADAAATATNTIDLVIGYTNGYAAGFGSQSVTVTRLQNLVATANVALSNSNVAAQVRLVGVVQVTYTDSTDNGAALNALTGVSDSGWPAAIPAALQPLRSARETYGADLVSLVRKFDESENDGCGVAWLNGMNGAAIASVNAAYGYSVVSDGTDRGMDGRTYYCEDHSLAHELAHNMGSQHDVDNAGGSQGRYPYSYGLKTDSTAGNFYTVMAYGDSGQISYNVFSNPNVNICGGRACGVSDQADNARSLNQTVSLVAAFRGTIVPLPSIGYQGQIEGAGGKCLDVTGGGTSNGSRLQVWACNGLRQQLWDFTNAKASFVSAETARVVDVAGYGTSNGSRLQLWDGIGGANQAWKFTNMQLVGWNGKVIDVPDGSSANGTRLRMYDNLSGANQSWSFDPRTGAVIGIGGKCLDVVGVSSANGAGLQLWECTGGINQKWSIGTGGQLMGIGGKCLDVVNGSTGNGAALQIWDCNALPQQRWMLRGEIRSVSSNRCLDDSGAGNANGAAVQIWDCLGTPNQRWSYSSR